MAGKKLAPPRGGSDLWKDHDPPIQMGPIDHRAAFDSVRWLTRTQYKMHRPDAMQVEPNELTRVLNEAGVRFVLMGHHGISGWLSAPRATRDVDVVVQERHHAKAVRTINAEWPKLLIEERPPVTRFLDPANNEPVVDVMRPSDLYREAFMNCVRVDGTHDIPNLELALASKFAAIVSRNRDLANKYRDAGEFMQMVLRNQAGIDIERLRQLGDAVCRDGGRKIEQFVHDALAGRSLPL